MQGRKSFLCVCGICFRLYVYGRKELNQVRLISGILKNRGVNYEFPEKKSFNLNGALHLLSLFVCVAALGTATFGQKTRSFWRHECRVAAHAGGRIDSHGFNAVGFGG